MEFSGRLFLAAIEEDNTQRALFRVRPLLGEEGSISQEQIDRLGDEGYLRVVPDRAEQHSFKDRMRELGQLCLIDLRSVPSEVSKVRNNKNYSPNYGEVNRYVIYSDAIRSLNEADVFEVVAEGRAAQPDTSNYYLRKGGHIQGPYAAGEALPNAPQLSCIAPDSSRLFSVTMPDGHEKLYFWPESADKKMASEDQASEESVLRPQCQEQDGASEDAGQAPEQAVKEEKAPVPSLSAKDRILRLQAAISPLLEAQEDKETAAEPSEAALPNKPGKLSGTPIRAGLRKSFSARRDSLSLSSVVDREVRRASRPQEPSSGIVGARGFRPVENPAEQFKQALRQLWNAPETKEQALDSFLMMDGAARAMGDRLSKGEGNVMQSLAHQQLNELEAERLALVMEIDSLQQNHADILKAAMVRGGKEAQALELRKAELSQALEQMQTQCEQLDERRTKLMDELNAMSPGGCRAVPGFGEDSSFEKAAKLVAQSLSAAGFEASANEAASFLLMALVYPQLALEGDHEGDARLAARLLSRAIGGALIECEAGEEPAVLPGGDAAVFALYGKEPDVAAKDQAVYTRLIVSDSDVLPRVRVKSAPGFKMEIAFREGVCIREESLRKAIDQARREIPTEAVKLLAQAESALGEPLPVSIKRDIVNYIGPAQTLLEGGITAAVDHAFAGFIIPFAKQQGRDFVALRNLCTQARMPIAVALL